MLLLRSTTLTNSLLRFTFCSFALVRLAQATTGTIATKINYFLHFLNTK